jgi:type IV pilus assembly protein PilX
MTRLHQSIAVSRHRQGGMTLLVGLMLLLLLTVISTIGFRNTTMSERMTGNSVDRNVAFQSAESAGKEALALISGGLFVAGTQGQYGAPLAQGGTTTFWTKGDGAAQPTDCLIDNPFRWRAIYPADTLKCAAAVTTKYANNDSNAQYVIELLTQVSSGGSTTSTYRVTSRSTGGSGNADVVLQTIFVRTTTP